MESNFDFLKTGWAELHADTVETERNAFAAPRTAVFYARRSLELAVRWMYRNDRDLKPPYQKTLAAMLHEPTFKDNLPPGLFKQARFIQKLGNVAVHSEQVIHRYDGLQATKSLHAFVGWVAKIYSETPPAIPDFDDSLIPKKSASAAPDQSAAQLSELEQKLAAKDAAFEAAQEKLTTTEAEVEKLKQHIAEIKAANEQQVHDEDYSEEETRDLFIDLMLREAGWDPKSHNVPEFPVTGMPYGTGEGFVDYVLWGKDGLPLAVVEAKRTKKSPEVGKQQAKLYADCLEQMKGQRPVIFYTNGYETWLWDDVSHPPRPVQGFYNQDELQLMVNRRTSRKPIATAPVNHSIVNRYYQEEATRAVMEHFERDNARKALVVMATGSGKTRNAIAMVEILMQANWVRRVLFLADRNALVRQAKNAFSAHLPHASVVNLVEEKEKADSRIILSTYPTMMNCIDDTRKDGVKRFGVGYFDLIIIDEAHRSIYQKYRGIFEYFDALLLGLTATPKADADRDTYKLFDLEPHVPTYAYELEQAVADEYLVPPKAVSVPLKFQRGGIKYADLSEEEQQEYEEKFYDDETNTIPDEIGADALNQWLFNADTVDKVLAVLMEKGLTVAGGDRLGKTIIFAKKHTHAAFIVERFDKAYPHLKGHFCQVIDNQVNYAQSLIDDFYVADKPPHIAVSVDMMDTGIDVPEVVNLVFFKRVRSKTKFWQMIGRGTRLCPDLFGPGEHKQFFTIFDFCENLEYFGAHPAGTEGRMQESLKQKIFKRRLALATQLQDTPEGQGSLEQYRHDILDQMHQWVAAMNPDNFLVRPHRRKVEEFGQRERWNELSVGDAAEISKHLTPLPVPDDDEEFARRFDLLMLNMQLAVLESSARQVGYQESIRELAAGLEEKKTIPSVAQQMDLIHEMQTDEYWEGVTLPMLEHARRRLRSLIQFVDREGPREKVYTDFEDELGEGAEVDGLVVKDSTLKNYRLKVEQFIREHQDHITIRRLRTNQPITGADLKALEDILFADGGPGGGRYEFQTAYGTECPLGRFVRSIVGLDRNAAKEAFGAFLAKGNWSAAQIRFIDQIINHLVLNGVMDPSALFEPPFTDLHHEGVMGVFPDAAEAVVGIIRQVNGRAEVA